jgi:hypothetical protein
MLLTRVPVETAIFTRFVARRTFGRRRLLPE